MENSNPNIDKKDNLQLIILNNGLVIKCKKEDIPSILSSQYDD